MHIREKDRERETEREIERESVCVERKEERMKVRN